jgi:hypothetical protein
MKGDEQTFMKEIFGKNNEVASVSRYQSGLPPEREENEENFKDLEIILKNTKQLICSPKL